MKYWLAATLAISLTSVTQAADLSSLLKQCAALKSTNERIACYDKVASNDQKQDSQVSEQVVTPRLPATKQQAYTEDQPQTAVDKFGAKKLRKPKQESEPEQIVLTVASTKQNVYKKWILTMENGQKWKQIDSEAYINFYAGDQVEIRKAMLGSFLLKKVDSNKSIRVSRIK